MPYLTRDQLQAQINAQLPRALAKIETGFGKIEIEIQQGQVAFVSYFERVKVQALQTAEL